MKMTFFQRAPRLPAASPSLITVQFEAFVLSLSDMCTVVFLCKILPDEPVKELKTFFSYFVYKATFVMYIMTRVSLASDRELLNARILFHAK